MYKNFYTSFGLWLVILPFLGIPGFWKEALVFVSGIFLILVAIGPMILKKIQIKPRFKKAANKKLESEFRSAEDLSTLSEGGEEREIAN